MTRQEAKALTEAGYMSTKDYIEFCKANEKIIEVGGCVPPIVVEKFK